MSPTAPSIPADYKQTLDFAQDIQSVNDEHANQQTQAALLGAHQENLDAGAQLTGLAESSARADGNMRTLLHMIQLSSTPDSSVSTPATPNQREDRSGAAPGPSGLGQRNVGGLTPAQYNDPTLSPAEANAACGPAAAVAFAAANGRTPTLREAVDLARQVGWTSSGGMNGVANQQALLDRIGIPTTLDATPDWSKMEGEVSNGHPVTISTPQHYFVAEGYDPSTGKFNVGNSGTAVQALGGGQWMSPDEISSVGRGVNGVLYVNHPLVATPSVAGQNG